MWTAAGGSTRGGIAMLGRPNRGKRRSCGDPVRGGGGQDADSSRLECGAAAHRLSRRVHWRQRGLRRRLLRCRLRRRGCSHGRGIPGIRARAGNEWDGRTAFECSVGRTLAPDLIADRGPKAPHLRLLRCCGRIGRPQRGAGGAPGGAGADRCAHQRVLGSTSQETWWLLPGDGTER